LTDFWMKNTEVYIQVHSSILKYTIVIENLLQLYYSYYKKQTGFHWTLFGTPGAIPEPSPILVFFDNFVRHQIASREPCFFVLG
jgi:hypothetical protein